MITSTCTCRRPLTNRVDSTLYKVHGMCVMLKRQIHSYSCYLAFLCTLCRCFNNNYTGNNKMYTKQDTHGQHKAIILHAYIQWHSGTHSKHDLQTSSTVSWPSQVNTGYIYSQVVLVDSSCTFMTSTSQLSGSIVGVCGW